MKLTTEAVVSPADGNSSTVTGLSIGLHVVAQGHLHAVVLTHVIDAVTQEGIRRHQRMAGPEVVREDDVGTLILIQLFLLCSAVRMDIWTCVWQTAIEKNNDTWFRLVSWYVSKIYYSKQL